MTVKQQVNHKSVLASERLQRRFSPSLQNWREFDPRIKKQLKSNVALECGWGRLIFGQTFRTPEALAATLRQEREQKRDIALYIRDPHVVLAHAPQELFLDPSHTYRLWLDRYHPSSNRPKAFSVRKVQNPEEAQDVTRLYKMRKMVPPDSGFVWGSRKSRTLTYLVAVDSKSGEVIGTVTGVDHKKAFNDPENGTSLWCLAVDPQCSHPGVGEALVRQLAEYYIARGKAYVDLSVMHDNEFAIKLYEKLGYERIPVFCLKRKNPFNENFYVNHSEGIHEGLNPYAEIIVREAQRRGVAVDVLDPKSSLFKLSFGGRTILCRESLTELTSAVAMSLCADKHLTNALLQAANLKVPRQLVVSGKNYGQVLEDFGRVVVKPLDGEQGAGITVDIATKPELEKAITKARKFDNQVIIEEYVEGMDVRIVVIGYKVVAAAVRKPPEITGTGEHKISDLVRKLDRRRSAATKGESRVKLDDEVKRCIASSGFELDDVLPYGKVLQVRKTANLHTGGSMYDVTDQVSAHLRTVAEKAAKALHIPVVGFDFLVPDIEGDEYVIIEANERPGLANHEPQPLVERFMDLLFPHSQLRHVPLEGLNRDESTGCS